MSTRQKTVLLILLVALMAAALAFFLWPRRQTSTFYPVGGIPFKIVAYNRTYSEFQKDMDAAKVRVAQLSSIFDGHSAGSELSRLNEEAGIHPFAMSPQMARVFELSRKWQKETGGTFDPTVGPLVDLWKVAGEKGVLPAEKEIAAVRKKVGLNFVSSTADGKILFTRDGMNLDLGAIAKGAIVDVVADLLKSRGVKRGVVEAGGDVLAFGDGEFELGIADPVDAAGEMLIGKIKMKEGGMATSEKNRHFVEIGGRKYSGIIDPRSGRPVEDALIGTTVIGGTSADAGALAAALMAMGLRDGMDAVRKLDWAKAVFITEGRSANDIWISGDLVPRIKLAPAWSARVHIF